MTETAPLSTQTPPTTRRASASRPSAACTRTSRSRSSTRDGRDRPARTPGEQCTRGYSVMLGYWNDPRRPARAIDADGWMHTGDLA
jgi:fatty-acyl-CoA synthase